MQGERAGKGRQRERHRETQQTQAGRGTVTHSHSVLERDVGINSHMARKTEDTDRGSGKDRMVTNKKGRGKDGQWEREGERENENRKGAR